MAISIPVMNAIAKTMALEYHILQVVWARFSGHLLCVVIVFWPRFGPRIFKSRNYRGEFGPLIADVCIERLLYFRATAGATCHRVGNYADWSDFNNCAGGTVTR